MRKKFAALSKKNPRNKEAEEKFILLRIEMIRANPHLSADEKESAIQKIKHTQQ